jgi:hypothetical protein
MTNDPLFCNCDEVITFLQQIAPEDLWVITAIWPRGIDGKPKNAPDIVTMSFLPKEAKKCAHWAKTMNDAGFNLYFTPNHVPSLMNRKPKKEDIFQVQWMYVDLDPREGYSVEEERALIETLLNHELPEGVSAPTLIIDSGSGMWGLWKLRQPITLKEISND